MAFLVLGLTGGVLPLFGSYSEPQVSHPMGDDRTLPDYPLPDNPHPTPQQLIEKLEPLAQQLDPIGKIEYQLGLAYSQQDDSAKAVAALQKSVKLDPKNAYAWHNLGANLVDLKKFDEALTAYQTATKVDPTNELAWNGLANVFFMLHLVNEGGAALAEGFKYAPNSRRLWNSLGDFYLQLSQFQGAEQSFKRATEIDNFYAIGWSNLGLAQGRLREFDLAIASCRKAIEIDPKLVPPWNNLAQTYLTQGRLIDTEDALHHSLALDPNQPLIWANLGHLLFERGDWSAAVEAFFASDHLGLRPAIMLGEYGEAAAHIGHMDDAHKMLAEAQSLEPASSPILLHVGQLALLEGKKAEAYESFQKALQLNPQNFYAMSDLALYYFGQGQYQDSVTWAQKAIVIFPDALKAWNCLAISYQILGQRADAARAFAKLTTISPNQASFWQGLALTSDDKLEIEKAATQATTLDPHDIASFRALVLVKQNLGKKSEAEAACRAAIALNDATVVRDWTALGTILFTEKKDDDSIAAFTKALTLADSLLSPAQALIWGHLGFDHIDKVHLAGKDEWQLADDAFQKAVKLDASAPNWWWGLGLSEGALGHNDAALAAFGKLQELTHNTNFDFSTLPGAPPAWKDHPPTEFASMLPGKAPPIDPQAEEIKTQQTTIETLSRSHRFDEALDLATKMTVAHPEQASSWLYLGHIDAEMQHYNEAEEAFKKSIALNPKIAPTWLFLGCNYAEKRDFVSAIDAFTKCIDLNPNLTMAWTYLIKCYSVQNDLVGCQLKIEDLTAAHPDAAIGWAELAGIEIARGLKIDVPAALKKAEDLKSSDPEVWCRGIGLAYQGIGEQDKAIAAYRESLRLNPHYDDGWNNLGYTLFLQGKTDEAIDAYKNALQANPQDLRALSNLISAYQKQMQWGLAKETCDKLAQLNPAQAEALRRNFPNPLPHTDSSASLKATP